MSESTTGQGDEFHFPGEGDGETFVRTLRDSHSHCYWCLAPLRPNPVIRFPDEPEGWPLETAKTFDKYGAPVDDVPPDRKDGHGQVVEASRDKTTICGSCGVLDPNPEESRSKETTRQALTHVVSILDENGTDVNPLVADETVTEAFADGRTGQFVEVLGTAISRSIE